MTLVVATVAVAVVKQIAAAIDTTWAPDPASDNFVSDQGNQNDTSPEFHRIRSCGLTKPNLGNAR